MHETAKYTHVVPKSIPMTDPYSGLASSAALTLVGAKKQTKAMMARRTERVPTSDH